MPPPVAEPRLALALCLSALAHAWLLTGPLVAHQSRFSPWHAINVRLETAPRAVSDSISVTDIENPLDHLSTPTVRTDLVDSAAVRAERRQQPESKHERSTRNANVARIPQTVLTPPDKRAAAIVAAPPVPDPTYYSARDLDVYPRPLVPLRLDFPAGASARLVLQLLIDEHGAVKDVTVVEATSRGEVEEKARSALAAIRFAPAMKDERAVKSRVLLRLEPGVVGRE